MFFYNDLVGKLKALKKKLNRHKKTGDGGFYVGD